MREVSRIGDRGVYTCFVAHRSAWCGYNCQLLPSKYDARTPVFFILFLSLSYVRLRGPSAQNNKNLYYSFHRDENLHIYVKSKIKWGYHHELSSIFSIENELFTENLKKGGPL